MRPAIPVLYLLVSACSSSPPLVAPRYAPSDVAEAATLPPGYREGETLHAACSSAPRGAAFDDETLDNVDCNLARLSRVLRARAGELSSKLIYARHCRSRGGERLRLECSAKVARPESSIALAPSAPAESAPAPSAAQVLDLDEPRPQDATRVLVAFTPAHPEKPRLLPARQYAAVAETRDPAVGRREVGQVSARCESCATDRLRHALRVTAGHVGAGELAAIRCFRDDDGPRCVATALEPWSS